MDLLKIILLAAVIVLSDGLPNSSCYPPQSKMNLVEHLGLNKSDNLIYKMEPLVFYFPLTVFVDLYVSSIIEVNEKAQSLSTQVKLITAWPDLTYHWPLEEYCGIESFVAPKTLFWIPDINIIESIKTEFGSKESPYVKLFSFGLTASSDILSLTTACKMDLYRFPFDTQTCNLTLQSTTYSNTEIVLYTLSEATDFRIDPKEKIKTQGEWELLNISTTKGQTNIWSNIYMDQLIYQITIKRRPLLYVINIILPLFFFLVLDVTSFFIEASAADKLNFKVTLLLSISVFLLMVNDTLPCTADKLPLIGIYCSGIFILIGISILETILVKFLMGKGAKRRSVETRGSVSDQVEGDQKMSVYSVSDQNEEQACTLDHLKQILAEHRAAIKRNPPAKMCMCWTSVARIIDVTFLNLYIIAIIAFLSTLLKQMH